MWRFLSRGGAGFVLSIVAAWPATDGCLVAVSRASGVLLEGQVSRERLEKEWPRYQWTFVETGGRQMATGGPFALMWPGKQASVYRARVRLSLLGIRELDWNDLLRRLGSPRKEIRSEEGGRGYWFPERRARLYLTKTGEGRELLCE
jgi:hypothetical protein